MSHLSWVCLLIAGLLEVGFTTFLKLSFGFTKVFPTIGFIACVSLSFWLFNKAMTHIPIGTAYAVFTGIGVIGTVLVQVYLFDSPLSTGKIFFMILLVTSIFGLKLTP